MENQFEDSLEKLNAIITQLETNQVPFSELKRKIEEAANLIEACKQELRTIEPLIEHLRTLID